MHPHHRRPVLTPRPARDARIPAYQLRRRRPSAAAVNALAEPPVPAAHVPQLADLAPTALPAAPLESPALVGAHDTAALPPDISSIGPASATSDDAPGEDDDYAEYRESVEAAAARSRAELRGSGGPRRRAAAVTAAAVANGASIAAGHAARMPAQAAGGRGGSRSPRGRAARGRRRREPDPRPLFKRRKTWFVMLAMLPVVAGIVALLYFGNLLKTSYDAYSKIHVDEATRTVYTVNAAGTPVVVPSEIAQQTLPNWDKNEPFNILLLGIDPRPTDIDPPRSDTIIIVHVDPASQQVTMMSVPRDLWVSIPEHGEDKINAAYAIGENDAAGGGPALVAQTIEANFGIRVPYWATVDFDGFRKIVNTIGGVVVDVPAPLKDDLYPTENLGVTRIYFGTGLQKMNGEQALEYARTRHGDNDIARGDRQQQMLLAIRQQAISLGLITQANTLIGNIGDSVRTDLDFNQMLALANLGRKIDSTKIIKVNLWELGAIWEHNPVDDTDPFYWGADWNMIYGLMVQYFNSAPVPSAGDAASTPGASSAASPTGPNSGATSVARSEVDLSATIVAQNASDVNLLATNAVRRLRDAGFSNALPETAGAPSDTTVIYDNTANPATAKYVAQTLGISATAIVRNPDPNAADIVVVLGIDAPVDVIQGQ